MQHQSIPDSRGLSHFIWAWGQFLDHELDLTGEHQPPEFLSLIVPASDAQYAGRKIPFRRSTFDPATGITDPREQINQITSYIDASNVYGSNEARAYALRTHSCGYLKTSPSPDGPLLPKNDCGLPNVDGPSRTLFLAGHFTSENMAA